jgi:hypothetical protein
MRGHNIECGEATTCNYPAITITGTGSVIQNLVSAESSIGGPFTKGVKCDNLSGSTVSGLRFEGISEQAIKDCAKAEKNVLFDGGGSGAAIDTSGVAGTDFIRNNYISGWNQGIRVTGNQGVSVTDNLIIQRDGDARGINVGDATSSSLEVKNNFAMGIGRALDSLPIEGNNTASFSGNFCDPDNAGCDDCIADGYCEDPVAPFTLP